MWKVSYSSCKRKPLIFLSNIYQIVYMQLIKIFLAKFLSTQLYYLNRNYFRFWVVKTNSFHQRLCVITVHDYQRCLFSFSIFIFLTFNLCVIKLKLALACVAQWIECRLVNQKLATSIPSQGISQDPIVGVREATTHWCSSLSLSPSLPLSLKINK